MLVVLYHAGAHVPGGFSGVDVFFVISGFVITGTLLRELDSEGHIHLPRFYARRVKRLLPALTLMVTVVALLAILAGPVGSLNVTGRTGVFASLFTANAYLYRVHTGYFDLPASLNPFLHTWTLAVEEQFYLFFPALLFGAWWLSRSGRLGGRHVAITAVAIVSGISFLLAVALAGHVGGKQHFAFYGSPTRAWEFGAGAMAALLVPWLMRLPRLPAEAIATAGVTCIVVAAFSIRGTSSFPGLPTLLPVFGAWALIAAGTASPGALPVLALSIPVAVWIGDLSYSWYLWHWPLIVFAKALWPTGGWPAPTFAALSLIPSWLSYRYVENPIRFNRRIAGRAVVALAVSCIAVSIAACLAFEGARRALASTAAISSYQPSQLHHLDLRLGCDNLRPLGQAGRADCTLHVPSPHGLIILIGDSNAGHFSEPVARAAKQAGFNLTIATASACPFIDLELSDTRNGTRLNQEMNRCRRFYVGSLNQLLHLHPHLVITAARSDYYIRQRQIGLALPSGQITYNTNAKQTIWYQALISTLRRLNNAGIPVLVAQPVPAQPVSVGNCATIRLLTSSCGPSLSRDAADRNLQPAITAELRAIKSTPAAWPINFENNLCNRDNCPSARAGITLYRDSRHLSVDAALTLTARFRRAIATHAR